VYTVGPEYAHAEARKSPALDGVVERDEHGKEKRYPIMLKAEEKIIAKKIVLAFKQAVCGFDLLRAFGRSYVCDVNGFSFVKNSTKYYDDCALVLTNIIMKEVAPLRQIPYSVSYKAEDPPIVPTTLGTMYVANGSFAFVCHLPKYFVLFPRMELRCVIAVIRHGDRTPKQKMKMRVKHPLYEYPKS
jgi:inositol hexakisphosphate/diphosphoinositol-pentakisphosphate kinase